MERIEVGRYDQPDQVGYTGWINPERETGQSIPAWVIFIRLDGTVHLMVRNANGDLE